MYYTNTLTPEIARRVQKVSAISWQMTKEDSAEFFPALAHTICTRRMHRARFTSWDAEKANTRLSGLFHTQRARFKRYHQQVVLHQSTASCRAGLRAGQEKALRMYPLQIIQSHSFCRSLKVNKLQYVMFGMYQCTQTYKSSRTTFVMHVFIPSFLPGDIKILIKSPSNT